MSKQPLHPGGTDTSTGPYTPGIAVADWVFVSGQGPLDPATHEVVGDTIEAQTELTLQNVGRVLSEAGCAMNDCVKVTVHLADLGHYEAFNEIYKMHFGKPYPARTLVQSVLDGIMVEIDAIAIRNIAEHPRQR